MPLRAYIQLALLLTPFVFYFAVQVSYFANPQTWEAGHLTFTVRRAKR